MEVITEGVNNLNIAAAAVATTDSANNKKNRIQVSNTKKPLFFYVNLAKRYMQQHNEVELSALGMAIATVVTIAEILKNNGLAVEKKIMTSTVDMREETGGRPVPKAKARDVAYGSIDQICTVIKPPQREPSCIEILLGKTEKFDELMAAAAAEEAAAAAEEQS
ncbi:DNA/RNA-BINDING PROTEIN ALBA 3 [Salix koriyanagi]|uniref:DNA/RNA-BINDING PROTEIN ALBA 3 n=1 Tax=Salix koriyanagi TaxID=2511006 RepID=A0A9Q0VB45_9ROSI|nr:DNA/RNA-BINDING PROTEIN ALBA 3 [Salix koriyanagi]